MPQHVTQTTDEPGAIPGAARPSTPHARPGFGGRSNPVRRTFDLRSARGRRVARLVSLVAGPGRAAGDAELALIHSIALLDDVVQEQQHSLESARTPKQQRRYRAALLKTLATRAALYARLGLTRR